MARWLTGRGIECQVAAPSKLQRPSGDRVKTDVRDVRHLARLLHLGEVVAVCVPSVAFGLAVEIGDWYRLDGRSIGAYLGLVPAESSSGATRSQGSITKTGNVHARRRLIEAAWHHRKPYRIGVDPRRRQDRADPAARDRGQRANRRLHTRWAGFDARRKRPVVANTVIARELAGWCWSLAVLD